MSKETVTLHENTFSFSIKPYTIRIRYSRPRQTALWSRWPLVGLVFTGLGLPKSVGTTDDSIFQKTQFSDLRLI